MKLQFSSLFISMAYLANKMYKFAIDVIAVFWLRLRVVSDKHDVYFGEGIFNDASDVRPVQCFLDF